MTEALQSGRGARNAERAGCLAQCRRNATRDNGTPLSGAGYLPRAAISAALFQETSDHGENGTDSRCRLPKPFHGCACANEPGHAVEPARGTIARYLRIRLIIVQSHGADRGPDQGRPRGAGILERPSSAQWRRPQGYRDEGRQSDSTRCRSNGPRDAVRVTRGGGAAKAAPLPGAAPRDGRAPALPRLSHSNGRPRSASTASVYSTQTRTRSSDAQGVVLDSKACTGSRHLSLRTS